MRVPVLLGVSVEGLLGGRIREALDEDVGLADLVDVPDASDVREEEVLSVCMKDPTELSVGCGVFDKLTEEVTVLDACVETVGRELAVPLSEAAAVFVAQEAVAEAVTLPDTLITEENVRSGVPDTDAEAEEEPEEDFDTLLVLVGVPVIDSSVDILAVTEAREDRVTDGDSVFSAVGLDVRVGLLDTDIEAVFEELRVELPLPAPEKLGLALPEESADTVLETVEETVKVLRAEVVPLRVEVGDTVGEKETIELADTLDVPVIERVLEGEPVDVRLVVTDGVAVLDTIEVFVTEVVGLILRVPVIDRVLEGLPVLVLLEVCDRVGRADPEALFDTDAEALAERDPTLVRVIKEEGDGVGLGRADLVAELEPVSVRVGVDVRVPVDVPVAVRVSVGVRVLVIV